MGKAADNEYKEGLHKVAEQLVGEVRFFPNQPNILILFM